MHGRRHRRWPAKWRRPCGATPCIGNWRCWMRWIRGNCEVNELCRGAWVIYNKHMHKFVRSTTELGGTLGAPLLLAVTFGAGMQGTVNSTAIGGMSYISYVTAGSLVFTALSGGVNSGMTILEEKIRGY